MKLWNFIPEKRNKYWLIAVIPLAVVIMFLLAGISCIMLSIRLSVMDAVLFGVISTIAAAAICGFGYAGLRIISGSCFIGTFAGVVFMAYVFLQPIEWVGVVGLVSGIQLAILFFLVGVNAQMISRIVSKRRKQNE